ncbi:poly-beta-1,6-N-acetyl-D-glucosamine N-deacetylase precursor [bacterium BMS3Abin03]|nr:poly-beta-1,6-N-acetyl-D-glucosamine N-deacetylase precursor [bacterium BMS3Abin03]HDY74910.1 polysaccharide deacetylase family protein [Candidatus Neomarinimicrobiota bacterium]
MRVDRLLTLGLFNPVKKATDWTKTPRIPILMYHSISEQSFPGKHPYYQTHTPPEIFREQMAILQELDYKVISLRHAAEFLFSSKMPDEKTAVITFDDAYQDFMTHAYPILMDSGFTATVFVPTGLVGKVSERLLNRICLSWDELAELSRNGMEIGSHTITHPKLPLLPREKVSYEIAYSKNEIEERLNREVESFSLPYAFPEGHNSFLRFYYGILKECGYRCGVTTRIGRASPKDGEYGLRRIPINNSDDERFFKAKLEGGYDWIGYLQFFKKFIHSSFV